MAVLKTRVKSSSILEVLIAMVVIMVVFGLALTIFTNVTSSSLSVRKLRAEGLITDAMITAEHSNDQQNATVKTADLLIEMKYAPTDNMQLEELTVAVYDSDHQTLIAQKQQLILKR